MSGSLYTTLCEICNQPLGGPDYRIIGEDHSDGIPRLMFAHRQCIQQNALPPYQIIRRPVSVAAFIPQPALV